MNINELENNPVLKKLADISDQVIFLHDMKSNKVLDINQYFEELTGVSVQKFKENPALMLDYVHGEDSDYLINSYNDIKRGEVKKRIEFRLVLPDRNEKWVSLSAYIISDTPEATVVAGFVEDITDRKAHMMQLLKINSQKNSTMEILTHDLAGPLTAIQTMVDLIEKKGKDKFPEELLLYTEMIKETCKRSVQLIQEFVNQEFIESSAVAIKKDRVDLVQRIKTVIDFYKMSEQYLKKNFDLVSNTPQFFIEIDDLKFMQVINNLISNAIKFTPDNGTIRVVLLDEDSKLVIKVEDNGIGIPKKYHPFLFDKFTKARRQGIRGEKSIGLGMSIIKTIVELHNGEIWFESEENKGTTFTIEIPKTN